MTKAKIDQDTCIGCGLCANICPECFEMGENGKARTKNEDCGGCDAADVADQCPVQAIHVSK